MTAMFGAAWYWPAMPQSCWAGSCLVCLSTTGLGFKPRQAHAGLFWFCATSIRWGGILASRHWLTKFQHAVNAQKCNHLCFFPVMLHAAASNNMQHAVNHDNRHSISKNPHHKVSESDAPVCDDAHWCNPEGRIACSEEEDCSMPAAKLERWAKICSKAHPRASRNELPLCDAVDAPQWGEVHAYHSHLCPKVKPTYTVHTECTQIPIIVWLSSLFCLVSIFSVHHGLAKSPHAHCRFYALIQQ